jgi:hypothetical protein
MVAEVRQPSLLFAGLALRKPEYVALRRKLDPDPTAPEIIRNFPVRQPVLWMTWTTKKGTGCPVPQLSNL